MTPPSPPRLGDRSLFPDLEPRAYLNHAAVSPPSLPVRRAIEECLADYAARGLAAAIQQRARRERARALAAKLVGATPDDIGLVQSTTAGVVALARSIPFRRGERIVLFEGEFPANVTPFCLLAHERGLEVVFLPLAPFVRSEDEGLESVRLALSEGARLVAVSAVQFQSGLRMPLRRLSALCHEHGAELFVDAIQALGAVPLDVRETGVDYLVAGGHKFLMGIEGLGIAYVAPAALRALSLGLSGWTNHDGAFDFLMLGAGHLQYDRALTRRASFLEQGAVSVLGCAALAASLELLLSLGIDAIFAHVTRYLDALEPELVALGCKSARSTHPAQRSATLSVRLPAGFELTTVAHALAAQGIAASTPDGYLRFAPHFANSLDEVELVARAVRGALGR